MNEKLFFTNDDGMYCLEADGLEIMLDAGGGTPTISFELTPQQAQDLIAHLQAVIQEKNQRPLFYNGLSCEGCRMYHYDASTWSPGKLCPMCGTQLKETTFLASKGV